MNLLVLTSRFPHAKDSISSSFVKNQIDCMKDFFEKIYIISLNPFIPNVLSEFPFMNPRWRRDALASDYGYDNVEVYFAKYVSLPFDFWRKNIGDSALKAAKKVIKDKNISFDLIHAHFTYPSGYVGANLKSAYGKPFILTIHEAGDWFLKEVLSKDEKIITTWMHADKIIGVNKKEINELRKFDINDNRLIYLPNGFSPRYFRPCDKIRARRSLGIPTEKRILLNLAGLEEYKGHKYLIESMKGVLATRNDVILYIIGQGPLERTLRSLINKYGMQDEVILVGGNKPTIEIALWMNACDVFILPSLSEGNPTVMFEALGCGKPFVGTNVGGIPEIIINDKLGILVEPRDANGLAEAILSALDNKWDADYIRDYAGQFTWDRIAERLLDIYETILN